MDRCIPTRRKPGGIRGWEWITNESFGYTFNANFANNSGGVENALEIANVSPFNWNDLADTSTRNSYIIEYVPGIATDVTMFTQRALFPGSFDGVWTSSSDGGFRTYDSFSVRFDTLLRQVTWQAMIVGQTSLETPITTDFQLGFYSDALGQPGTELDQQTLSAADVARVFVGTRELFGRSHNVYNYTATLSNPVLVNAGANYWFSPFSKQATFNPTHSWMGGEGVDNLSYQDNLFNGDRSTRFSDRAFSVRGLNAAVTVPEPGTLALFALPLIGFAVYRKRHA